MAPGQKDGRGSMNGKKTIPTSAMSAQWGWILGRERLGTLNGKNNPHKRRERSVGMDPGAAAPGNAGKDKKGVFV